MQKRGGGNAAAPEKGAFMRFQTLAVPPPSHRRAAFTLIELLVVIAIIGVLAALLLSALSQAKSRAQTTVCLNNQKQLQLAWLMYADENEDQLPDNTPYWNWQNFPKNWVGGVMSYETEPEAPFVWTHADSTNTALMLNPSRSQLGPFVKSYVVFKCPSDKSWIQLGGQRYPRVRSYAMNEQVGDYLEKGAPNTFTRKDQIGLPVWVFIDTHEDSTVDGWFEFGNSRPAGSPANYSWQQPPASRHNGSGVVSFSDGHVEAHKWVDGRTIVPVQRILQGGIPAANSKDIDWLRHQCGW